MNNTVNRDIEYLEDYQHMWIRPSSYIGPTELIEDKIPIVDNGVLLSKTKIYSVGMYRLFDEVLDNCFDEALRCISEKKSFKEISISVNTKDNSVTISDTGQGFKNGIKTNPKTKITNIETAMTKLRAGSNFKNDDTDVSMTGRNGIGISATNVFSEIFEITTSNTDSFYYQKWENFKSVRRSVKELVKNKETGTKIKFIPRSDIFQNSLWDLEILKTKILFRNYIKNSNTDLKKIKLSVQFDNVEIDLKEPIFPKDTYTLPLNKRMFLMIWPAYDESVSISFVNGSLCTGFHQTYVQEFINNTFFNFDKAHKFYETLIVLDLPPRHVSFQEQNKTRFVTTTKKMEEILKLSINRTDLKDFLLSKTNSIIKTSITDFSKVNDIKKIKKAKRTNKINISDKFISSNKKEDLFLVEGNSASGGLAQKRDSNKHAIYALRGKVKNAKTISDLSENKELMELISILNLNVEDKGETCDYKRIIISCDSDNDGYHIVSLIINFFAKWFPNIINSGKLFILKTPLASIDTKRKRDYYYKLSDIPDINNSHIRYLKGLGSLDVNDWDYVYKNMKLLNIKYDTNSTSLLNIIFGDNSKLRKYWLTK